MITPRKRRFAQEYVVDRNAKQAAIRAGYAPNSAAQQGSRLLNEADVARIVRQEEEKLSRATGINAAAVLERWWALANADAAELSQFRRGACRYCHGNKHAYQWIDTDEYLEAAQRAAKETPPRHPDASGGFGYQKHDEPAEDCPRCGGEGLAMPWFADTRTLSPAAAALFDGVKQSQNGIEIKTRDRDAALLNVAKHLGMFTENIHVTSPDGSMQPTTIILKGVRGKHDDD